MVSRLLLLLREVAWARRLRCHGTTVCCQYTDLPTCNSPHETHWRGRRQQRLFRKIEERS